MRWLDSNTDSMDMNLSKLQEMVKDGEASVLQSKGWQRVGHDLVTEQQKCIGQGGTQKRLTTKLAERGGWGRGTGELILNLVRSFVVWTSRWPW